MTEVKTKLAELSEARAAAEKAFEAHSQAVKDDADTAARLAREAVAEKHAARTGELVEAKRAAIIAWQAEVDATATHEWEGRKVFKVVNKGRSWNRQIETVYGVVEVRRSNTEFAENVASYALPEMGTQFVRLLKSDGTVGKRIDTRRFSAWKLAE